MTQPIPQHAVDAALDEWFKQNLPNWRESVAVWTDPWREGMARAISAALTSMGASVVVWRKPEEWVPHLDKQADDLVSRVDALEQDGAHDHDEIMTQGARIAELEVRPVWTKEKEDLLHRLTTEMSQTLAWRGRNEQAHDIADLRDAAFPETKL